MDVKRFKEVFDTLDDEGQRNVISQLSDEELNAVSKYNPQQERQMVDTFLGKMPRIDNKNFDISKDITSSQFDTSGIEQAARNIPQSAGKFVSNIAGVITSPVQTLRGLGTLSSELISGRPGPASQSLVKNYADRYGGAENIRNTMIEDPVGFAADLSTVTGIGGGLLRASKATKAADVLTGISKAVDPVQLAGKAIVASKPVAKAVAANVLGRTTGSGAPAMYKAMEGKPEFIQAMRGEVDDLQVVEKAQDAFGKMKEARAATYRNQLKGIKSATQELDISDIKSLSDDWLNRFGVKKIGNKLDFSRSTLSGSAVNDVKAIYDDIQQWGGKAGDKTPLMLDTLKRRISDFYTENGKARAMAADLSNAVQKKITSAVPEYGQMTKDYAKASDLIKSTEQAILSKNPKAVDTALRKIMMGVREEKGLRRSLMEDLSKYSDEDILSLAAGRVSNPWFTRRLESSIVGTLGVVGGASVAPLMFALIPMSSPRLAAEASVMLGRTARAVEKGAKKIPRSSYLAAQQVGNINESINGNQVQ